MAISSRTLRAALLVFQTSADYNSNQAEGKYYFAQTEQEVAPAFESIQNEIIRLSK